MTVNDSLIMTGIWAQNVAGYAAELATHIALASQDDITRVWHDSALSDVATIRARLDEIEASLKAAAPVIAFAKANADA